MNRPDKYNNEMQTIQTLGQKCSVKHPELIDYACNLNADKLGIIDIYIEVFKEDPEIVLELKSLRQGLLIAGRAKYMQKADILTNLSFLTGTTGRRDPIGGKRPTTH